LADGAVSRRRIQYLAGGWLFALGSIIVFAWLTAGPYVRQNLRPLAGEADIALRECRADPSCARDAADLVGHQVTLLRQTRTVVYLSAWSVSVLAVLAIAIATVLILRASRVQTARVLSVVWKVQLGWAAALLIVQGVMLAVGADVLGETPQRARMFTSVKAFDSPFTDVGHLYYLAWFAGVGFVAALITRALQAEDHSRRRAPEPTSPPCT
jgi:hypothetical protein